MTTGTQREQRDEQTTNMTLTGRIVTFTTGNGSFERFQELTQRLLAVPKTEIHERPRREPEA
jgi:hypothetical protein